LRLVEELATRDRQVRAHERAHVAAAAGLAHSGASYEFTRGPDGKQYATGGEVRIDVSPVANDPQATIDKAARVRRAALAPTDPSPQDRAVAARATALANAARIEQQQQTQEQATVRERDARAGEDAASRFETGAGVAPGTMLDTLV
jgi:hypothetical protein